jgi:chromosome segregation ATPase
MSEYTTIIITLATVLTSAGAWQFWQKRLKLKHDERTHDKSEQTMFRDDLRERVAVLEQKLEEAYSDKAQTERKLTEVLTKLAEYKVRLEFLEKENDRLKTR